MDGKSPLISMVLQWFLVSKTIGSNGFPMDFGPKTIASNGFSMVFGQKTTGSDGFPMVFNGS